MPAISLGDRDEIETMPYGGVLVAVTNLGTPEREIAFSVVARDGQRTPFFAFASLDDARILAVQLLAAVATGFPDERLVTVTVAATTTPTPQ